MGELLIGLSEYFALCNNVPHQSPQQHPMSYASGSGGGALIIDKYGTTQ
jgi:hypothetical protein